MFPEFLSGFWIFPDFQFFSKSSVIFFSNYFSLSEFFRIFFGFFNSFIEDNLEIVPVNATLLISGWFAIAAPAVGPYPVMTLITPSGNPASLDRAAMNSALNGVCSAGFITIVHPAARAGPHFQQSMATG